MGKLTSRCCELKRIGVNTGPLHLRIFLSSPGDVPHEREAIVQLVKEKLPYDELSVAASRSRFWLGMIVPNA